MLLKALSDPRCFYGIFSDSLFPFQPRLKAWVSLHFPVATKSVCLNLTENNFVQDASECPPRQCRLAILCWMDGGNSSQQGCGSNAWLYSCCMQNSQTTVKKRNPSYNYPAKPKRHDVVQNSFKRRRADSSENQIVPICGIPRTPSSTLQKRIIGGRPAHFAEFPWQSHIRIREFQCGGGLIWHISNKKW